MATWPSGHGFSGPAKLPYPQFEYWASPPKIVSGPASKGWAASFLDTIGYLASHPRRRTHLRLAFAGWGRDLLNVLLILAFFGLVYVGLCSTLPARLGYRSARGRSFRKLVGGRARQRRGPHPGGRRGHHRPPAAPQRAQAPRPGLRQPRDPAKAAPLHRAGPRRCARPAPPCARTTSSAHAPGLLPLRDHLHRGERGRPHPRDGLDVGLERCHTAELRVGLVWGPFSPCTALGRVCSPMVLWNFRTAPGGRCTCPPRSLAVA